MQDRISRIQKREENKQKFFTKNKTTAEKLKQSITEGLEKARKIQEQILEQKKAKNLREKVQKSILTGMISARINNLKKDHLKDRLEKERENAQQNIKTLKVLENKEQELVTNLQQTAKNTKELLNKQKIPNYMLGYNGYRIPSSIKKNINTDNSLEIDKTTVGSTKTTNRNVNLNKTFDLKK